MTGNCSLLEMSNFFLHTHPPGPPVGHVISEKRTFKTETTSVAPQGRAFFPVQRETEENCAAMYETTTETTENPGWDGQTYFTLFSGPF